MSAFRQPLHAGLCLSRFCCACQLLLEGLSCQETMCPEQEEHGSFGFLEYAVQQQDSCCQGNDVHYLMKFPMLIVFITVIMILMLIVLVDSGPYGTGFCGARVAGKARRHGPGGG